MRDPRLHTHLVEGEEVGANHMSQRNGLLFLGDGRAEEISNDANVSQILNQVRHFQRQ